ncbi:hypothetical protein C8Q73DRAFT_458112 [Cubamyces lactineus]|nr:hypothetical protein C8Q73DRAFT_458112 [Cubamyces lactineus]
MRSCNDVAPPYHLPWHNSIPHTLPPHPRSALCSTPSAHTGLGVTGLDAYTWVGRVLLPRCPCLENSEHVLSKPQISLANSASFCRRWLTSEALSADPVFFGAANQSRFQAQQMAVLQGVPSLQTGTVSFARSQSFYIRIIRATHVWHVHDVREGSNFISNISRARSSWLLELHAHRASSAVRTRICRAHTNRVQSTCLL